MSMSLYARQTLALTRLEHDPEMQQMIACEPDLQHVLTIAANQTNGDDRWIAYAALKKVCYNLVGWGARHPSIREDRHYLKMIQAIDELLPDSDEYDENPRTLRPSALDQQFQDILNARYVYEEEEYGW
jgi:hypothetical protein